MNFRLTLWKILVSLVIGFAPGYFVGTRQIIGGGLLLQDLIIVWIVVSLIIYVIWSLFQKK